MENTNSEILTIMMIDLVGYSSKSAAMTREEFLKLHDIFDNLSLTTFSEFSGKVIKKIGDAFLITFQSPTDAVHCGKKLLAKFSDYNEGKNKSEHLRIRVALNTGEILHRENDIYGDAVNVAARIEGIAPADEIYFSNAVYQAINKNEIPCLEVGYFELKNIPEPVKIFKVRTIKDDKYFRMEQLKTVAIISTCTIAIIFMLYYILTKTNFLNQIVELIRSNV